MGEVLTKGLYSEWELYTHCQVHQEGCGAEAEIGPFNVGPSQFFRNAYEYVTEAGGQTSKVKG